ncbi:hypothetical protein RchiOBHm_Chr1g0338951 [Rosa chinensis]|uniref:MORF/ORRM1/DAG-like MORF domain-containing protein n=1 Tax=Rosa chinensis TaxID=74649 RepID=A0A2P6SD34_ROSCH|nr:hypothetical protein RchiOBHm_Chr1g0338951 [Rosa chinensis]
MLSASTSCHWIVLMETPPQGVISKQEVIEYYIKTVQRVLGNDKDAQMCIYNASWETHFGFCCDVNDETSHKLALFQTFKNATLLFPHGNTKHWLVRMDKPGIGVVTKAQMVDYYAQILTKVLGKRSRSIWRNAPRIRIPLLINEGLRR